MVYWIELMGRHAAASTLTLSGRMHVNVEGRSEDFEFRSAPGGRWRIESPGDLVYLSNLDGAALRTDDGSMQQIRGQFHNVRLGAFQPQQLLGLNSLLLGSMSGSMAPTSEPQETVHAGRKSWSTTLGLSGGGPQIEVVIDDATGVLVGLRPATGPWSIDVTELVVQPDYDETMFDWRRVVRAGLAMTADYQARITDERIAILAALEAALERREEVLQVCANAADSASALRDVAQLLELDEAHATAVLDMQFRRLGAAERAKISSELEQARRNRGR